MAWQDGKGAPREVANYRADIKLGDGMPRDPLEDAQEAQIWGDAISLEEKVRIRRPEWSDKQVDEEIARIKAQQAARAPSVPNIPTLNLDGLAQTNGTPPELEETRRAE